MSLPGRVLPPWLSKAGKSTSVSRHIPIVDTPLPAVAPGTKLSTIAIERICKLLPIAYPRVIVLDTETTGFSSEDTIIEIGAVELIGGRPSGLQYHTLIETTRSIHPKATEVHGLTKQLLQGQPTISQVLPNFLNFISSRPSSSYSVAPGPWDSAEGLPSPPFHTALLAHNAKFDVRMLKQEIDRLGLESPEVLNHTFCTQQWISNRLELIWRLCTAKIANSKSVLPVEKGKNQVEWTVTYHVTSSPKFLGSKQLTDQQKCNSMETIKSIITIVTHQLLCNEMVI
eukprot:c7831_g1_i3.p1 GENE.c7831_g1_i3~~c7831_g1_i3.p1  ORF type:complete len:285 (+),score=50.41 c7831_g1_i3:43-897(+)